MIAAPTGAGKTTATAKAVATCGSTCWLVDRLEDVDAATAMIEQYGGQVGRVLPLDGKSPGPNGDYIKNCIHDGIIEQWQEKGYNYRSGFCKLAECCERAGDPLQCPFLASLDALADAHTIVTTKARAKRKGFFTSNGNQRRETVVVDEDPIALIRPAIEITRDDLERYIPLVQELIEIFDRTGRQDAKIEAEHSLKIANFCWNLIAGKRPGAPPEPHEIRRDLRPPTPKDEASRAARIDGRRLMRWAFQRRMREDPVGTIRNVYRDLDELVTRNAGRVCYATSSSLIFHLRNNIPRARRIIVLDATAIKELLTCVFAPRPIVMLCAERVQPTGRVIQLMDAGNSRITVDAALKEPELENASPKLIRIIDAIGDRHPSEKIILISYKKYVQSLCKASKHAERILTAHFGALRGRNDLEGHDCYIVVGSPLTTEADRQQLALAVYGRSILPFPELVTLQSGILGRMPAELGSPGIERIWGVQHKGYTDPRMQNVYRHTVTAELTHAADRARVLINPATVYLLTNEPCPSFWFAEKCFAKELLGVTSMPRSDLAANFSVFEAQARRMLDEGQWICGADVSRALGHDPSWGKRYWVEFLDQLGDALEGSRKFRWKDL